jgi:cell division protein ZapA (FtsZ GTPase activity inhibitor)
MTSGNVTVTINGKDYPMACVAGEEEKVKSLGGRVDEAVRQVIESNGAISESRALVMAALILMDQVTEFEDKFAHAPLAGSVSDTSPTNSTMGTSAVNSTPDSAPNSTPNTSAPDTSTSDTSTIDAEAVAEIVEHLAARLEKLAAQGVLPL